MLPLLAHCKDGSCVRQRPRTVLVIEADLEWGTEASLPVAAKASVPTKMMSIVNRVSTVIVAPRDTPGGGRGGPSQPPPFASYDCRSLSPGRSSSSRRTAAVVTAVDARRMGFAVAGPCFTKRRCSMAPGRRLTPAVRAAATPSAGDERQTWIPLPRATLDLPPGDYTEVASAGVTYPLGFRAAAVHAGLRAQGTRPDLSLIVCDGPVRPFIRHSHQLERPFASPLVAPSSR